MSQIRGVIQQKTNYTDTRLPSDTQQQHLCRCAAESAMFKPVTNDHQPFRYDISPPIDWPWISISDMTMLHYQDNAPMQTCSAILVIVSAQAAVTSVLGTLAASFSA